LRAAAPATEHSVVKKIKVVQGQTLRLSMAIDGKKTP
jgi:hypothetical protein